MFKSLVMPFVRRYASHAAATTLLLVPSAAIAAPERGLIPAGPQPDLLSPRPALTLSGTSAAAVSERSRDRRPRRAVRLVHPVDGRVDYGDVIAAFGHARGRPHQGQDIFAPAGTPLRAPADGRVIDAGSDGGRGNWLAVYDAERKRTYSFFHLLGPAEVEVGERVRRGEKLGEVGCTGSCSGDHLHFEIREGKGPYGEAVDPMPMLERTVRRD